ncbi:MAG: C1 family peptidase [Xanthobacteraceae bacterium]|nr:C1 family peptidase [Xanthobacteraceae bacterium]
MEWAKIILPLLLSWPAFGLVFLLFFHGPLIGLIDRFSQSEGSKAEFGPVKVEIGKVVLPPQYRDATVESATISIDLSRHIAKIKDQGPLGSTVGYSAAYTIEISLKIKQINVPDISPRGIYEVAKEHDEWSGTDYEGSSVMGALKGAKEVGFFAEQDWPSNQSKRPANIKPIMKIKNYTRLPSATDVLTRLKAGQPVAVSIQIPPEFDNPKNGVIKLSATSKNIGGHSICVVGYNEESKLFKFANSWGERWGDKGYGYISENDLRAIWVDGYTLEVGPT